MVRVTFSLLNVEVVPELYLYFVRQKEHVRGGLAWLLEIETDHVRIFLPTLLPSLALIPGQHVQPRVFP